LSSALSRHRCISEHGFDSGFCLSFARVSILFWSKASVMLLVKRQWGGRAEGSRVARMVTSTPRSEESKEVQRCRASHLSKWHQQFLERVPTDAAIADNNHNVYSDTFSTGGFLPFRIGGFPPSRRPLHPAGRCL
jgi:hypothetical protein